jgi:hypothetical protein
MPSAAQPVVSLLNIPMKFAAAFVAYPVSAIHQTMFAEE